MLSGGRAARDVSRDAAADSSEPGQLRDRLSGESRVSRLSSGYTAALRQRGVAKIIIAVPVGAPETCRELQELVDETVCAFTPEFFQAVGQFYHDFAQTSDEEVRELLRRAAERSQPANHANGRE